MSFTTIDATDPGRLAAFRDAILGTEVEETSDAGRFVFLGEANGHVLGFQRVPEPKSVKNRVHLDVRVDVRVEGLQEAIDIDLFSHGTAAARSRATSTRSAAPARLIVRPARAAS